MFTQEYLDNLPKHFSHDGVERGEVYLPLRVLELAEEMHQETVNLLGIIVDATMAERAVAVEAWSAVKAQRDALVKALANYGTHHERCPNRRSQGRCDCGLHAAFAQVKPEGGR